MRQHEGHTDQQPENDPREPGLGIPVPCADLEHARYDHRQPDNDRDPAADHLFARHSHVRSRSSCTASRNSSVCSISYSEPNA